MQHQRTTMSGQVSVSFNAREARNTVIMSDEEFEERGRLAQKNRNISLGSLDENNMDMERRGTFLSQSSDDHNEPETTVPNKKKKKKKRRKPPEMQMIQNEPNSTKYMETRKPIVRRSLVQNESANMNNAEAPRHVQNSQVSVPATNPEAIRSLSSEFKRRYSQPQESEFNGHAMNPNTNSRLSSEFKRRYSQSHDDVDVVNDPVKNPGANSRSTDLKRNFNHPHNSNIHDYVPDQVPVQNEKLEMLRRRRDELFQNYRQISNRSLEGYSSNEGPSSSNEGDQAPMISIQEKQNDPKQGVLFSLVEIRQYPRMLGDNPSCRSGPPVTLGWDYDKSAVVKVPVEEFDEIVRQNKKKHFVLSRREREGILFDEGYTQSQIAQIVRQMIKIKNQRKQTINNLPVARIEETLENAIRKMKKVKLLCKTEKKGTKNKPPIDIDVYDELNVSSLTLDISRHMQKKKKKK